MPATETILQLTTSQAACLEAVNLGLHKKTKIALHTKRDLKTVASALDNLNQANLIERTDPQSWRSTKAGKNCNADIVPDPKRGRRGTPPSRTMPGSTAERMLDALAQPRSGKELVSELGVSHQRILQLAIRHYAEGNVRFGDPDWPLQIIARSNDKSILLTRDQERALSAIPEKTHTTATKLSAAISMVPKRLQATMLPLKHLGLVTQSQSGKGVAVYELTVDGRAHLQRRAPLHFAEPAPLPVKSDRVRKVLSFMQEHGEVRIRDIGDELGITRLSMNALMQYLKRKGLTGKTGKGLHDPYVLTDEGNTTLSEMTRRSSD